MVKKYSGRIGLRMVIMQQLLGVILVVSFCGTAFATLDPDSDQLGVYFDIEADVNCISVMPETLFYTYVVITKPSEAEVWGLEFHYHLTASEGAEHQLLRYGASLPPGTLNLGLQDIWTGEYVISFASPLPGNGTNDVIVTWQFMMLEEFILDFYLGPTATQSIEDGLPAYLYDGAIYPLGVSSGDPSLPVASVNGDCRAVVVEGATFGRLKCLFR